jgi:YD repeat-containing protein
VKCSLRSPLPTGVLRSFVAPQEVRACPHPTPQGVTRALRPLLGKPQWQDKYDLLGRVTQHIDPDTGVSNTLYDDAGNTTSTSDSLGNWLDFT